MTLVEVMVALVLIMVTRLVDDFQAGKIPVLVCSISAAGVGITLTKASDMLFVETDWTPALITQAEDRCHRIGQEKHVICTTLIASGTLDEHIQSVLRKKAQILDAVMAGGDHAVAVDLRGETTEAASTLFEIVKECVAKRRYGKKVAA
jgi:SWI/SNF-related matrix-associated actin-dependent regulator 1 of chromatin subfamily A